MTTKMSFRKETGENTISLLSLKTTFRSLLKKAALPLVAVGLAGIMSTTEAKANWPGTLDIWTPGHNIPGGIVQVGRVDNSIGWAPVTNLTFGAGVSGRNEGLWNINSIIEGLNIGRAWNRPISNPWVNNDGKSALFISKHGTVGINTWNPNPVNPLTNRTDVMLDVWGYVRTSFGLVTSSDSRYKRAVEPISNIEKLFKLNSIQYMRSGDAIQEQLEIFKKAHKDAMPEEQFKRMIESMENQIVLRNSDTTLHFGFIAQELREVFPNLVSEDGYGFLSVNYTELIPVLVDVVKEQQKQINYLLTREKGKAIGTDALFNDAMLFQNNPNPFSAHTEIKFYIPDQSNSAFISIYDMTGREVMKLDIAGRGHSSVTVNGRQLQAGMYLYSLIVDGREIDTKRMILTNN